MYGDVGRRHIPGLTVSLFGSCCQEEALAIGVFVAVGREDAAVVAAAAVEAGVLLG